ncbi:DUF418 domain-containing protein [Novosphingobium bradum]|uniref:DUF418 domain-containing protein n=1 Tax=Novosphingobium bradum TaxID=1737444 RepID=A0ABV7IQJ6_9SPHN
MDAATGLLSPAGERQRLASLDLLRGLAVLGILAINIGGFAGPIAATLSPNQPVAGTLADEAAWALALVVFEGKMRALFTLLFGASLLLFMDRAESRGRNGERLQFRRLGWLAVAGYLHYLLLWWGDILFTYALAGLSALAFRQAPPRALATAALVLFAGWHLTLAAAMVPQVAREDRVLAGQARPGEAAAYAADRAEAEAKTTRELARDRAGLAAQAAAKWHEAPGEPIEAALTCMGETLPLMLLGMALYRGGFFSGRWPRPALRRLAIGGIATGGALTIGFLACAWPRHFPPDLMQAALAYGLAVPHLLMALGYGAALLLALPALAPTSLGQRLIAAGRMAFTNYIAMSLVMGLVFQGWGLDLIGTVPERWQGPFVALGWALMLGWSKPWLARFRHGPLEWLWRSATWGRIQPLRR